MSNDRQKALEDAAKVCESLLQPEECKLDIVNNRPGNNAKIACANAIRSLITAPPQDDSKERLDWLHNNTFVDADGWEYGVARCKFKDGKLLAAEWTLADHSDIDAARVNSGANK